MQIRLKHLPHKVTQETKANSWTEAMAKEKILINSQEIDSLLWLHFRQKLYNKLRWVSTVWWPAIALATNKSYKISESSNVYLVGSFEVSDGNGNDNALN